jgi:hypothetical protein
MLRLLDTLACIATDTLLPSCAVPRMLNADPMVAKWTTVRTLPNCDLLRTEIPLAPKRLPADTDSRKQLPTATRPMTLRPLPSRPEVLTDKFDPKKIPLRSDNRDPMRATVRTETFEPKRT